MLVDHLLQSHVFLYELRLQSPQILLYLDLLDRVVDLIIDELTHVANLQLLHVHLVSEILEGLRAEILFKPLLLV